MELSREEIRLLNLGKREVSVLRALETLGRASIQELAEYTSLPRSSLQWPLAQLYRRNIVAYALKGKRKQWHSRLGELVFRQQLGALESVAGDMRVVEGIPNILKLYKAALDLHKNERVLILEGNRAVHTIARKSGTQFMRSWHKEAQKKQIILESILGDSIYQDVCHGRINSEVVNSLAAFRLWVGYVVPDEFIETDVALMLFRDVAVITDWEAERAVVLNSPQTVRLLRSFCEALQQIGRKIDIVSFLRSTATGLPR